MEPFEPHKMILSPRAITGIRDTSELACDHHYATLVARPPACPTRDISAYKTAQISRGSPSGFTLKYLANHMHRAKICAARFLPHCPIFLTVGSRTSAATAHCHCFSLTTGAPHETF